MPKPIIHKIIPFDTAIEQAISFSWDGNPPRGSRLIISDSETGKTVYDVQSQSGKSCTHILPGNTLTNGKTWQAKLQVIHQDGLVSPASDTILFYTLQTPEFYFTQKNHPDCPRLTGRQTLNTAVYEAAVYYFQAQYESLQSYRFYLYDMEENLLEESSTMYRSSPIAYRYQGLKNHAVYFIRCMGITASGLSVDTGKLEIYTDYASPDKYAVIHTKNDADHGYIRYYTNIKIIRYNGDKSFSYIDGLIDLREDSIYYDSGFLLEDDFTLQLRGMFLHRTRTLLKLKNGFGVLILDAFRYDDGRSRFRLMVPALAGTYVLYTEPLSFEENDMVIIGIRKKKNLYQLKATIDYGIPIENNMWYGQPMPTSDTLQRDIWIDSDQKLLTKVEAGSYRKYFDTSEPQPAAHRLYDLWIGE